MRFVWSDPSGWPWLVIGAGVVLLSLPLVLLVELVASLSDQTALVQSLRQELRTAELWFDRRLAILGYSPSIPTNEAEFARPNDPSMTRWFRSYAAVVTKPDCKFASTDDASSTLTNDRLRGMLNRLVTIVEESEHVRLAELFVTIAFGYGKRESFSRLIRKYLETGCH